MGGNRNRNAGNQWERDTAADFNFRSLDGKVIPEDDSGKPIPVSKLPEVYFELFPKVGTTREYSKALDSKKVDITVTNPKEIDDLPYLIQNKSINGNVSYANLLRTMSEQTEGYTGTKVVFHRETEKKVQKNGKIVFKEKDRFAVLFLDDFLDIIFELRKLQLKLEKYEKG